jgi:hypothetical protein
MFSVYGTVHFVWYWRFATCLNTARDIVRYLCVCELWHLVTPHCIDGLRRSSRAYVLRASPRPNAFTTELLVNKLLLETLVRHLFACELWHLVTPHCIDGLRRSTRAYLLRASPRPNAFTTELPVNKLLLETLVRYLFTSCMAS